MVVSNIILLGLLGRRMKLTVCAQLGLVQAIVSLR